MTSNDHVAQMLSRLVSQYLDKAGFRALLTQIGATSNNIEAAASAVGGVLDPTTAVGQQLDICGSLVGVARELPNGTSLDDTTYRVLVLAIITRNHCKGTLPEIHAALRFIFDPASAGTDVHILDLGRMAIDAQIGRLLNADEKSALAITAGDSQLEGGILPRPSGVRLSLSERDAADFFCFSDISDPGVPLISGGMGFSDISSPTGSWASEVL